MRKILRTDETDFSYARERQAMSRIGSWQGQLEQFVSSNAGKPSREWLTLIRPQSLTAQMVIMGLAANETKARA